MKYFLSIIFIGWLSHTDAKNYYFSTSSGNDSRTPAQAQSALTPWKSLSKINSVFNSLSAGDSVLLKRGDIFYGSIKITKSGLPDSPIVIAAYGEGSLPVISGFVTLSHWNLKKDAIYESSEMLDDSLLNMVTINDTEYAMGRYPNADAAGKGWLTITSHADNNSITDASLPENPEWQRGEIIIRKKHFVIDRNRITAHAGNTLNYTGGTHYLPSDGFGYFIQNHIATLDKFGEWFYNPSTKKLNVYFGVRIPSSYTLRASNISTLISVRNQENIVFDNLCLEGSNLKGFHLYYSKNISIKNCLISFSGEDAIDGFNTTNAEIESCTILNSNNNAIDFIGACNGSQIKNNIIKNTGLYAGMAGNSGHSFSGINIDGDNNIVECNEVDNSGYAGIRFEGNSTTIKNNYVNFFCLTKDDGGGIYTGSTTPEKVRFGQTIEGNIILNGVGAKEGTSSNNLLACGIYLDDNSANVQVTGNTVASCSQAGILLHNSHDILVSNNTCYDNTSQLILQKDAASKGEVRSNTIVNNILFAKHPFQFAASFLTNANDIRLFGKIDSNYYSRPLDNKVIIATSYVDKTLGKINRYFDLQGWSSHYNKDISSKKPLLEVNAYKLNKLQSANKFSNKIFTNSFGLKGFRSKVVLYHSVLTSGDYLQVTSLPDASTSYITMPVGNIDSGKNYLLRFSLLRTNDSEKTLAVYLRKRNAPFNNLTQTTYQIIPKERVNFEIALSALENDPDALLVFTANEPNTSYSIGNIELHEADVSITNPEDHLRFKYNSTSRSKIIMLDATYADAKNKRYVNSITLAPYSSVILLKQE